MSRFKDFSDDEVYILSRQATESSFHIVCENRYNDEEIAIHTNLMNELIEERRKRDYNISKI